MKEMIAALPAGTEVLSVATAALVGADTLAVRFPQTVDLPEFALLQRLPGRWRYQWEHDRAGVDRTWALLQQNPLSLTGQWSDWAAVPPWVRL